jgi:hypothetical protein
MAYRLLFGALPLFFLAAPAESGVRTPPSLAPIPATTAEQPIGSSASRMFPHGHPLHICGSEDDGFPWLEGRAPSNPWSSLTERSRSADGTVPEWSAGANAAH